MSSEQVKACVLHAAGDLRVESRTIDPPAAHELQVSVHTTTLCGSDLHYFNHGRNGDIIMREPLILGHEASGFVTAIGSHVKGYDTGQNVALEVGQPCGTCARCKEGRYNICKDMEFRASARRFPHCQGTLQQLINVPAEWCYKLPDNVSLDVGALLEPMSVALHAARRARLSVGATVLVFGAGAVGLLAAAMAKIHGAAEVLIADIDQGRLDFAVEQRFADSSFTVPQRRGSTVEEELDIAKETAASICSVEPRSVQESIGEVDVVFECTGVPSCVQAAIYATRSGGRVVLVGMGNPVYTLPVSAATSREVDIIGSFRYANTYPDCIKIVSHRSSESPNFSALITHRSLGYEQAEEAFKLAGKTKDSDGRLVLKVAVYRSFTLSLSKDVQGVGKTLERAED